MNTTSVPTVPTVPPVPIVIICYNNYRYVANTLKQIASINKEYYANIIILNNSSTCPDTIAYLNTVDVRVINNVDNLGPWITPTNNKHIYNLLPDKYIITDPDLKLNPNIPSNFIEILATLADKYKTSKIGFALDITDHEKFYPTTEYMTHLSIRDWELQFWKNKIEDGDEGYEIYKADIDTTFCLMSKTNIELGIDMQIRVAGDFTAKHIPWYIDNEVYNVHDSYKFNTNTTHISTISRIAVPYIDENYLKIHKNNERFFIEKNDANPNLAFWRDIYGGWKNELFDLFDSYLSKEKVFVDIGTWVAPTAMYGARKAKHTYAITGDADGLCGDMKANCANYTVIARYDKSIEAIFTEHAINGEDISLISVDLRGEEEKILNDLYNLHCKYNVPLLICVYYNVWEDKNLDRFPYLSENSREGILSTTANGGTEPISIFF